MSSRFPAFSIALSCAKYPFGIIRQCSYKLKTRLVLALALRVAASAAIHSSLFCTAYDLSITYIQGCASPCWQIFRHRASPLPFLPSVAWFGLSHPSIDALPPPSSMQHYHLLLKAYQGVRPKQNCISPYDLLYNAKESSGADTKASCDQCATNLYCIRSGLSCTC